MASRIEDYAIIGDTKTIALVDLTGSIDWWCAPRIDSGAAFAALLGDASNGRWMIAPRGEVTLVRCRARHGRQAAGSRGDVRQGPGHARNRARPAVLRPGQAEGHAEVSPAGRTPGRTALLRYGDMADTETTTLAAVGDEWEVQTSRLLQLRDEYLAINCMAVDLPPRLRVDVFSILKPQGESPEHERVSSGV